MEKRLVRNVQDKKIAGVCAGIGDYFNMDHTLVRALWIIFTLLGGSGILAYAVLYCLLEEGSREQLFPAFHYCTQLVLFCFF